MQLIYNFISSNVKGMQASKKRLKLFECLKQNINFNGLKQVSRTIRQVKNIWIANQNDETYSKKANKVRIKSECDWYESSEKSNKFFLNLEKTRASLGPNRTLVKNEKEINDPVEIDTELQDFYKMLFISLQHVVSLLEDLQENVKVK